MAAPLQPSDVQGIALLALATWATALTTQCQRYGAPAAGSPTRGWTARLAVEVVLTLARLYALSKTPLIMAVVTHSVVVAVVITSRSSDEHPLDFVQNALGLVLLSSGSLMTAGASVTDQNVTASMIRERFTRISVLGHLLACTLVMLFVLAAINESYYSFSSDPTWFGGLRRAVYDKLRRDEVASTMRARGFAALSGLAAGCALLNAKCVAEVLRTNEAVSAPSLSLLVLMAIAWAITAALESYWWHHAILSETSNALVLLLPYLCVRVLVGVTKGAIFFGEISPRHAIAAAFGLIAIFLGLASLKLRELPAPPLDDPATENADSLLLDATARLLDSKSLPEADEPSQGSYRPPAHFRAL